jgi:hypothetical protein
MTRRLRRVFAAKNITDLTEHTFFNDFCQVHFPFVRQMGDRYVRAIHPLNLDKAETPKIVEHTDHWKTRLQRLRGVQEHPDRVLLVVRKPAEGKRLDVTEQMCKELEQAGAVLLPQDDQTGIVNFAQIA